MSQAATSSSACAPSIPRQSGNPRTHLRIAGYEPNTKRPELRQSSGTRLAAQAETLDQGAVTLDVDLLQVVEKTTTIADHEQQTATGVVIVLVELQVLGEIGNALGEQCDLDLRGARVTLMGSVLSDDVLLQPSVPRHPPCNCAVPPTSCRSALYPRAKHANRPFYALERTMDILTHTTASGDHDAAFLFAHDVRDRHTSF